MKVFHAQYLVLSCNTGCTVVQVTDAQVLATHCNHRPGTKAKTLSTHDGRLDDIKTGFQTTIGLYPNLGTQTIGSQYLMRFGHAEFPR